MSISMNRKSIKNVVINFDVVADIKDFLKAILEKLDQQDHSDWIEHLKQYKKFIDVPVQEATIRPRDIIEATCDLTDKETIYVTDVGQHQMWAAQYLKHEKAENFLTSGGLGTMGYGYGAAIGAQAGNPEKRVIHFTGDEASI